MKSKELRITIKRRVQHFLCKQWCIYTNLCICVPKFFTFIENCRFTFCYRRASRRVKVDVDFSFRKTSEWKKEVSVKKKKTPKIRKISSYSSGQKRSYQTSWRKAPYFTPAREECLSSKRQSTQDSSNSSWKCCTSLILSKGYGSWSAWKVSHCSEVKIFPFHIRVNIWQSNSRVK